MRALDILGYSGAALGVAMLAMRTMIPLRLTGVVNNIFSMAFGLLSGVYPMAVQHALLLPLNIFRLFEMLKLTREVRRAKSGDHSMLWLRPYMSRRPVGAGEVLFRKGDAADRMFMVVSGRFRLPEIETDIVPGTVVGELGFVAPESKRTQSLECVEDGVLLEIAYGRLKELYFQNPTFGLYFLELVAERLFDTIGRLESDLAARNADIARLRANGPGEPITPQAAPPASSEAKRW